MTTRSMFFDAVNSDRQYDAAAYSALIKALVQRDGVIYGYGSALAVAAGAGMTVTVPTGAATILGRMFEVYNTSETLTIPTAHATLPRVDRVVVRLDLSQAGRSIVLAVKQGVAQGSPLAPALQRDTTVWELSLARVAVGAGVTSIVAGNITDERSDITLCGWVLPGNTHTGGAGDSASLGAAGLSSDAASLAKVSGGFVATDGSSMTVGGPIKLKAGVQETGGAAILSGIATAASQYFRAWTPFRNEMTNVPSSITLSGATSGNLGPVTVAGITKYGFKMTAQSSGSGTVQYSEASYVTVGN